MPAINPELEESPDEIVRSAIAQRRKDQGSLEPVAAAHAAQRHLLSRFVRGAGGSLVAAGFVLALAPYVPPMLGAEAHEVTDGRLAPDLASHDIIFLSDEVKLEHGGIVALQAPGNQLLLDRVKTWDDQGNVELVINGEMGSEDLSGSAKYSIRNSPVPLAPLVVERSAWFAAPLAAGIILLSPFELAVRRLFRKKGTKRGRRVASAEYVAQLKLADTEENRALLAKERRAARILNVPSGTLTHLDEVGTLNCFTTEDRTRSVILDDAQGILEFGPPEGKDAAVKAFLAGQRTLTAA